MTIEKMDEHFGYLVVTYEVNCDFCSDSFEVEAEYFSEVIQELKDRGWKYFKDEKDEWTHKCPACQEEGRDDKNIFRIS